MHVSHTPFFFFPISHAYVVSVEFLVLFGSIFVNGTAIFALVQFLERMKMEGQFLLYLGIYINRKGERNGEINASIPPRGIVFGYFSEQQNHSTSI